MGFPLSLPSLPDRASETIPEVSVQDAVATEEDVLDDGLVVEADKLSLAEPATPLHHSKRQAQSKQLSISTPLRTHKSVGTPFEGLPPQTLIILLTFYDAINNNPTFCAMVFADSADEKRELYLLQVHHVVG